MRLKWYAIALLLNVGMASATTVDVVLPGPVVVKGSKAIFLGRVERVFIQPLAAEKGCLKSLLKIGVEKPYKGTLGSGEVVYVATDNRDLSVGKRYVFIANGMYDKYPNNCSLGDKLGSDPVDLYLAVRYQSTYEVMERTAPHGKHQTLFLVPQCEPYYERLFDGQAVLFDFKESGRGDKCPVKAGDLNLLENKIDELQKMRAPWEGA